MIGVGRQNAGPPAPAPAFRFIGPAVYPPLMAFRSRLPTPAPWVEALIDAGHRLVYRVGAAVLRRWWAITNPDARGAAVALWVGARVLVVTQSYRAGLGLPGGGLGANEEPRRAAARELAEEVGVVIDPTLLIFVGAFVARFEGRRDHVDLFEATLPIEPPVTIDRREIIAARFVDPVELMADPDRLQPHLRDYLAAGISLSDARDRPKAPSPAPRSERCRD